MNRNSAVIPTTGGPGTDACNFFGVEYGFDRVLRQLSNAVEDEEAVDDYKGLDELREVQGEHDVHGPKQQDRQRQSCLSPAAEAHADVTDDGASSFPCFFQFHRNHHPMVQALSGCPAIRVILSNRS